MNDSVGQLPSRNWPTLVMFVVTLGLALTVVPLYGSPTGTPQRPDGFAALLCVTENCQSPAAIIGCFSHATYQAHPTLKVILSLVRRNGPAE